MVQSLSSFRHRLQLALSDFAGCVIEVEELTGQDGDADSLLVVKA